MQFLIPLYSRIVDISGVMKKYYTGRRLAMDPSDRHRATTTHLVQAMWAGTLNLTIDDQDMRRSSRERRPGTGAIAVAAAVCALSSHSPASADTARTGLVSGNDIVDDREDGSGAFRTHCLESHTSHDDPLVFPGQPGAAHHHVFFGNPGVDAHTTVADLNDAGRTTCDGGTLNRSAYWVPALYDERDERIEYVEPLFYYKTGYHVPASAIVPPPEGADLYREFRIVVVSSDEFTNTFCSTLLFF